ncbi:PREDICTED: disease resistance protein RPS4-like [Camelina sativa]|uniref:Disease resistance protein RPS4-like n=1 Tax=Camelina sativa TaxID=90675 RepID=A0ABM1QWJ0_CAMSA|nr:PREDICTED: disease resistance protein RPS4-like [Camelina sativa]
MHALVEKMGRQIVRQGSKKKPHKQLILWDPREISKVLGHNLGTNQIHCLALHMCEMRRNLAISCINFLPLYNLKYLKFYKHLDDTDSKLQFVTEDNILPPDLELRLLHWDAYPLITLPFDLHLECLVELKFRYSNLESLWEGTPELGNLRRLDVTGSKNLKYFPDISMAKKLEDVSMNDCARLEQFPSQISVILFALRSSGTTFRCHSFSDFPLLTVLNLINLNLENIPSSLGKMHALEKLNFSGNDFKSLPRTMKQLQKLKYLDLHNCCKLEALPPLTQVETLILSNCINLQSLLELPNLLEDHGIHHLLELELDNCKNVQSLSHQLSHFTNLEKLDLSKHDFETMPASIKELSSLRTISLNSCRKLKSLEELPLSLKCLYAHGCYSLEGVTLSYGHYLEDFDLDHCFHLKLDILLITWSPTKSRSKKVPGCCFPESGMPNLCT